MSQTLPTVGNWYQETSQGFLFEVVAYDPEDETVEVQYLEGEIEEYDLESWAELKLRTVAPPEDWRTGYELSSEDSVDADATIYPEDWSGALNQLEPEDRVDEDVWTE